MGDYYVDAFLQLQPSGSKAFLEGESSDHTFKVKPIEIVTFSLTPPSASAPEEDEQESSFDKARRAMAYKLNAAAPAPTPPKAAAKAAKKGKNTSDSIEFQVTKEIDVASTFLFQKYCETMTRKPSEPGSKPDACQFDLAKVVLRKSGGDQIRFLIYRFGAVNVVSYSMDAGSDYPLETIRFSFREIEMRYNPQEAQGVLASKYLTAWNFADAANSKQLRVIPPADPDDS